MTMAKNGFSAHSPKLLAITGVSGSDVALVVRRVSRSKLNVRAAEKLAAGGVELPTFVSPTVPGASLASNDEVFEAHEELMLEARGAALEERRGPGPRAT